jgi:hypothetical protein
MNERHVENSVMVYRRLINQVSSLLIRIQAVLRAAFASTEQLGQSLRLHSTKSVQGWRPVAFAGLPSGITNRMRTQPLRLHSRQPLESHVFMLASSARAGSGHSDDADRLQESECDRVLISICLSASVGHNFLITTTLQCHLFQKR